MEEDQNPLQEVKKTEAGDSPQILPEFPTSPEEIIEIAKTNPKKLIAVIEEVRHSFHAGPIPPAAELAEYNKIAPDLVNRIVAMAEKNLDNIHSTHKEIIHLHAQGIEQHTVIERGYYLGTTRGQYLTFFTVLLTLGLIALLGLEGHDWLAGTVFGGLAGILLAYQYKKIPSTFSKKEK